MFQCNFQKMHGTLRVKKWYEQSDVISEDRQHKWLQRCFLPNFWSFKVFFFFVKVFSEAVAQRCSPKRFAQNSQENTCAQSLFFNVAGLSRWLLPINENSRQFIYLDSVFYWGSGLNINVFLQYTLNHKPNETGKRRPALLDVWLSVEHENQQSFI